MLESAVIASLSPDGQVIEASDNLSNIERGRFEAATDDDDDVVSIGSYEHIEANPNNVVHSQPSYSTETFVTAPVDIEDQNPDNLLQGRNVRESESQPVGELYTPWFAGSPDADMGGVIPRFLLMAIGGPLFLLCGLLMVSVYAMLVLIAFPWFWHGLDRLMLHAARPFCSCWVSAILYAPVAVLTMTLWSTHWGTHWDKPKQASIVGSIICLTIFGLLSWGYIALESNQNLTYTLGSGGPSNLTFGQVFQTWTTGLMPKVPLRCELRVQPHQAPLFSNDIYLTQIARVRVVESQNYTETHLLYHAFDFGQWNSVRNSQTLCSRGFEGNIDLYGLGIRIGLYLQWLSSLLANNLLSKTGAELQKVYSVFSLAICLATVISSGTQACVFSIEVEIMYMMYWGGLMCVFVSSPCPIQLGSKRQWTKLDWGTVILFATCAAMSYHAIWYIWYGYDQYFPRMPCGTYHFFFAPVLDPGHHFWALRDWFTAMVIPWMAVAMVIYPAIGLILLAEVKQTIRDSVTYEILFSGFEFMNNQHTLETESQTPLPPSRWRRVYEAMKTPYIQLRETLKLPSRSRPGIRLITPLDVTKRKYYRIRWAAIGFLSLVLSIVAIELSLKRNRVEGVHTIASTGQYLPLIVGAGSFISVSWALFKQEAARRRKRRVRQALDQDEEGYEMQSVVQTITAAVTHAIAQPDQEFLMNGGLLPASPSERAEEYSDARTSIEEA